MFEEEFCWILKERNDRGSFEVHDCIHNHIKIEFKKVGHLSTESASASKKKRAFLEFA